MVCINSFVVFWVLTTNIYIVFVEEFAFIK